MIGPAAILVCRQLYAMGSHDTFGVGGIDTGSRDLSGGALGGFVGQNYHVSTHCVWHGNGFFEVVTSRVTLTCRARLWPAMAVASPAAQK